MAIWHHVTKDNINIFNKANPLSANPVVARCTEAWIKAFRADMRKNDFAMTAGERASEAFRAAMPPLSSRENCRDFIACVAHGTLIGAIPDQYGSKLIYAAQVAVSTLPKEDSPKAVAARGTSPNPKETQKPASKKKLRIAIAANQLKSR